MMNVQTLNNHWNAYNVKSFDVANIHRAWHAYQNNNFQDSIQCATLGVNDQITNLVTSLYIRASAQGMEGDYDSAIKDAKLMIKLMPSAGNLLLGNLYSLQCHYAKAMKAYQRGLSYVAAGADEDNNEKNLYQDQGNAYKILLEQGYTYAQTKMNHRMDVISTMPLEILDHIVMNYLTLKDRMTFLQVCKSWRHLASRSFRWWRSIKSDTEIIAEDVFFLGCHVDHHILDMDINVTRYDNFNKIFAQMIHGKYNSLKKLDIKYFDTRFNKHLFKAIPALAPTLTHLTIDASYGYTKKPIIPFTAILSTFNALQVFHYMQPSVTSIEVIAASKSATNLKMANNTLTDLMLSLEEIGPEDMKQVLSFCPNLRNLTLLGCSKSDPALINYIHSYCKKLEYLGYNQNLEICDIISNNDSENSIDTSAIEDDDTSPLRGLAIHVDNPQLLESLYIHHTKHINVLQITFPSGCINNNILSRDTELFDKESQLLHLKSLSIHMTDIYNTGNSNEPAEDPRIISLLRKSTNLTSLRLYDCTKFGASMIDAIAHLKNLKKLAIIAPRVGFARGLPRLIQGFATTSRYSPSLEQLVISRQTSHNSKKSRLYNNLIATVAGHEEENDPNSTRHFFDLIQHIPAISSLKTIEFYGVDEEYSSTVTEKRHQAKSFSLFCQKLQDHPSIQTLEFVKINCVSSESLQNLSKSITLKQLKLDSLSNVQERDLCIFHKHSSINLIYKP